MSIAQSFGKSARDWLADHLEPLVWIALVLWSPPIIFTVLIDLGFAGGAGSGYLPLRDPGLLLAIMQIVGMAAAVTSLRLRRRLLAFELLCGSLGVWWMHAAWTVQGRLRLIGRSDLVSRETLLTLGALMLASAVLFMVRRCYTRPAAVIAHPTTDQPRAVR